MAMAVITTPSFPAHRLLGVVVRMTVICLTILSQLSRTSTLFASPNDGVACPVTVHPAYLFIIARVPRDSGVCCSSQQGFLFCITSKFRRYATGSPANPALCRYYRRVASFIFLGVGLSTENPAEGARRHFHCCFRVPLEQFWRTAFAVTHSL